MLYLPKTTADTALPLLPVTKHVQCPDYLGGATNNRTNNSHVSSSLEAVSLACTPPYDPHKSPIRETKGRDVY